MTSTWSVEQERVMRLSDLAGRLWLCGSVEAARAVCLRARDIHPDASVRLAWRDQAAQFERYLERGCWG